MKSSKKNSITVINLKREWVSFKSKTGATQKEVSLALGWSESFFGSLLRGNDTLNVQNLIKIANLFEVTPAKIDPDFRQNKIGAYPIYATTSGGPAPYSEKQFYITEDHRLAIWNDVALKIEEVAERKKPAQAGATFSSSHIPPNITLFCSIPDELPRADPRFPVYTTPVWLVLPKAGKTRAIRSPTKPKVSRAEIYRITAFLLV